MELLWMLVFAVLIVEMVLTLLVCIPLPTNAARGLLVGAFKFCTSHKNFNIGVKVIFGVMFLLFVDSIRTINHLDHDHHGSSTPQMEALNMARLFRNQRNAYITGFSLFLFIVLFRLASLNTLLHESREELKALRAEKAGGKKDQ